MQENSALAVGQVHANLFESGRGTVLDVGVLIDHLDYAFPKLRKGTDSTDVCGQGRELVSILFIILTDIC
jgi:hypothetical protein